LRPVTGKAFARALERQGWQLHHTRGSHHYYIKDGEQAMLCVPIHAGKNLKRGTQATLMKLASLTDSDL
jgi:predicted RNA binding protein YcfA (HicA-like mRNA interferase family)